MKAKLFSSLYGLLFLGWLLLLVLAFCIKLCFYAIGEFIEDSKANKKIQP